MVLCLHSVFVLAHARDNGPVVFCPFCISSNLQSTEWWWWWWMMMIIAWLSEEAGLIPWSSCVMSPPFVWGGVAWPLEHPTHLKESEWFQVLMPREKEAQNYFNLFCCCLVKARSGQCVSSGFEVFEVKNETWHVFFLAILSLSLSGSQEAKLLVWLIWPACRPCVSLSCGTSSVKSGVNRRFISSIFRKRWREWRKAQRRPRLHGPVYVSL